MSEKTSISVRIEVKTKQALEDMARERRMQTGDQVAVSDLIREALEEFVKPQKAAPPEKPVERAEEKFDLFDQEQPQAQGRQRAHELIRARALELQAQGMTQRQIAAELGASQSVVCKALKLEK